MRWGWAALWRPVPLVPLSTLAQVAPAIVKVQRRNLGVSPSEYRELEAGTRWPSSETWGRICRLFGWPQTFATHSADRRYGAVTVAEEQWLGRQEAAKRAGVHYNVIRDWERKGLVEWKKAGNAQNAEILIEIASLDSHLSTRSAPRRLSEGESREKVAALEAEVRELRAALAKSETERHELLDRLFGRLEERRPGPA